MAFDFATLFWHQQNDAPSDSFTPIWNKYLESGCTAKMTREEALQSGLFHAGDLEAAVNEISDLREELVQGMVKNGTPRNKAEEQVAQNVPYEFLFIYMM